MVEALVLLCDTCSGCDGGYGDLNRYGMPPRGVSAAAASDAADAEVDAMTLSEMISSDALANDNRWLEIERAGRLAADSDTDWIGPSGWCSGHAAASMLALSAGMRKYDTQITCILRIDKWTNKKQQDNLRENGAATIYWIFAKN